MPLSTESKHLPVEETKFGPFEPMQEADGTFSIDLGEAKSLSSQTLNALRYHWFADKMGRKWEGAHGTWVRLEQAEEAAEAGEPCPVLPDPREEAKEWGIPSPY